jgi:tellurite resistance protein
MNDAELIKGLNALGIDAESYRVLALLPLVQVAWADGAVQPAEADLIRKLAHDRWQVGPAAEHLLDDWLKFEPNADYHAKGRALLRELVRRTRGLKLDAGTANDVVSLAQAVAAVAGGLFGMRAVSPTEKEAIREIAAALSLDEGAQWASAFDDLEDEEEEETDDPRTDAMGVEEMEEIRAAMHNTAQPPPRREDLLVPPGASVLELLDAAAAWAVADRAGIGRSRKNEIPVLGDSKVSRHHAFLALQDRQWWIQDLGSENGTWVNGARVTRRQLFGGEEIVVGATAFVFRVS